MVLRIVTNPVIGFALRVGERHSTRENVEGVEHSRGEENTFACVAGRVSGQLPLRQLKDGVSLIEQTQQLLDFPENADAVVGDDHFRVGRRLANLNVNLCPFGVIDGIVEHLSEAVLPQSQHVVRQLPEYRANVLRPDDIFRKTRLYGI